MLKKFLPRAERVLEQVRQRFANEKIKDRLVSMFDPDARPIRKGKLSTPTQFGSVVQVTELTANTKRGARGLLLPPTMQVGNPTENELLPDTVAQLELIAAASHLKVAAVDGGFTLKATRDALATQEEVAKLGCWCDHRGLTSRLSTAIVKRHTSLSALPSVSCRRCSSGRCIRAAIVHSAPAQAVPSLSNPTILVLAAVCSLAISFQVLLPVAPVLLERSGPHGAAGAATAALFVATVVGDFLTPWLMSRWDSSRLLIAGGLLIAVPSLIYMFPHAKAWQILLAAGVRGLGTGVAIVVCVALLGELAPSNRRGRWIGYFGLATGVPGIVCPSIGVALLATSHADLATWIAFLGGSCVSLVALRLRRCSVVRLGIASNLFVAIRQPGLLALFGGFVLASCTFGGVITYAPVALPPDGLGSAALFLLITGASRAASRSLSGILGDHQPVRLILILGIVLSIVGLVALAVRGGPVLVLIAAAAYGIGIGGVQTGAYLAMTQRSSSLSWSVMSAVWNIAIDLGGSVGGALIGLSAALSGYSTAAWVMPATLLVALPLLWSAGRSISVPPASGSART